jgi:hypothetical protein
MEKDGVRPEDEKYRELIDLRIRTFAKNYITITGTIDERLEKIRAEIRKYESKNRKKTQIG